MKCMYVACLPEQAVAQTAGSQTPKHRLLLCPQRQSLSHQPVDSPAVYIYLLIRYQEEVSIATDCWQMEKRDVCSVYITSARVLSAHLVQQLSQIDNLLGHPRGAVHFIGCTANGQPSALHKASPVPGGWHAVLLTLCSECESTDAERGQQHVGQQVASVRNCYPQ